MLEKTAENALFDRMVNITGSVSGAAELLDQTIQAHPETTEDQALAKIATMSLNEILEHPAFVAGFEARLAERMPELDEAAFAAFGPQDD